MGGIVGIVFGSDGAVERNGVLGGVMGERGESSLMIYLSLLGLFRLMWGRSCLLNDLEHRSQFLDIRF